MEKGVRGVDGDVVGIGVGGGVEDGGEVAEVLAGDGGKERRGGVAAATVGGGEDIAGGDDLADVVGSAEGQVGKGVCPGGIAGGGPDVSGAGGDAERPGLEGAGVAGNGVCDAKFPGAVGGFTVEVGECVLGPVSTGKGRGTGGDAGGGLIAECCAGEV